jgi:hypothetical protein
MTTVVTLTPIDVVINYGIPDKGIKKGHFKPLFHFYYINSNYPIVIRLNSATVNPFETASRYCATVFELSLTKA